MFSLAVLLTLLSLAQCQDNTVVKQTTHGPVTGTVIENIDNGDFHASVVSFYAVPFAKADRFARPSRDFPSWDEPLVTRWNDSQACPQSGGMFDDTHPGWRDFSEDCLHSNIFIPYESSDPGPYPVMVWFYGGAFNSGGNIMYPGHFLATRDVIVVVPNWRVNYFGFAYTASDACPGNFGLWDQHAALEWVQDNIVEFGGDPNRVTAFGQSAGAASTGHHIVSPQSQGLFHQAILESGTESNFWSVNWPEQSPEDYIWQVAEELDCAQPGFTDVQMIDCLRLLPFEDVRRADFRCTRGHFCQGMAPVIDAVLDDPFLPKKPQELREDGNFMKGPIISGLNFDDASMYTAILIPSSFLGGYTREEFERYLRRLMMIWDPQMTQANDTLTVENWFQAMDWNYAPWPNEHDEYENRNAMNRMITDGAFGVSWDTQLKHHHLFQPQTYGYQYNYRGRNGVDYFPEWMGVPHQAELPQVWGWTLLPWNEHVREDCGIWYDMVGWTDEDRQQTRFWQTIYTNFAKTGNPTPSPVQGPVGEPITWRPFSNEDMAYIYVNNVTIDVRTEFRQQDYAFFREYMSWITRNYYIPIY